MVRFGVANRPFGCASDCCNILACGKSGGKYLAAFDHKASDENEQSIIGVSGGNKKILFKQIAGIIARRIVYKVNKDDEVRAGDRFGLIHYGSRVDMFFPLDVDIKVKMNEMVKSGESIIGEFK